MCSSVPVSLTLNSGLEMEAYLELLTQNKGLFIKYEL